ncbi:MAG: extracellular solute-binding protein, partial [Clostridia bacterium]|nr:extracellular solute-binding protein [Clostridia bacterium]
AVMAFTLSLDDFVISYFVAPPNFQTLPLLIYSMTKKKVKPDMYALSTIIVVTIFILLLISNFKSDKKDGDRKKKRISAIVTTCIAVIAIGVIIASSFFGVGGSSDTIVLNVYNWGEYMADGSDSEYGNVNQMFEDYYFEKYGKRVVINYSTYATNEDLFSKLNNSAVSYDIVIPSDYMIEKLIEADLLLEFDVNGEIPNYVYINDSFKKPYYDENERYSVPYTYGMMGIIYNKDMVDEEDLKEQSWGILWNEKYAGKILQFNNPRDAFATAMYWKGLDINSTDPNVWDEALECLIEQKSILQGYVNDEIFDKMTSGSAAIAPYFVGDYITMAETEGAANLGFYYPNEGVNYFVDAMCIPKSSKNPEVAKEYINFMLSAEPAIENAEFIYYASPNTLVSENEDYIDYMGEFAYELLYDTMPEDVNAEYNAKFGTTCYKNFTPEIQSRINTLWENLKLADSDDPWIHIVSVSITVVVIFVALYSTYIKKKRSRIYRLRDKKAKKVKQA